MNAFPKPSETKWIHYKHFNENKLGKSRRSEFPPVLGALVDELNSQPFLDFLGAVTGFQGLLADPLLEGGGIHQSEKGGFLNIHTDFLNHHYYPWKRRLNLILYFNEAWKEEWNGNLELWDADMTRCFHKVVPLLNRAVLFNTHEGSFHGFPDRLLCPGDTTRKSLALYYYTQEDPSTIQFRSTNYLPRPGEKWTYPLIWLDKKLIHIYSLLKSTFKFSDDLTGWFLGRFQSKK